MHTDARYLPSGEKAGCHTLAQSREGSGRTRSSVVSTFSRWMLKWSGDDSSFWADGLPLGNATHLPSADQLKAIGSQPPAYGVKLLSLRSEPPSDEIR